MKRWIHASTRDMYLDEVRVRRDPSQTPMYLGAAMMSFFESMEDIDPSELDEDELKQMVVDYVDENFIINDEQREWVWQNA